MNSNNKPFNIDLSWSDWNIRIFKDCAWALYIQTSIYEGNTENPNKDREVRFLEKKNNLWKIVYSATYLSFYNNYKKSFSNVEYNINNVGYNLLEEIKLMMQLKSLKRM